MVNLLRKRIDDLQYEDSDSLLKIKALKGAGTFVIIEDSRSISPLQPEYRKAINDFESIEIIDFNIAKGQMLSVIDELESKKDKSPSISELFSGSSKYNAAKDFKFQMLLLEQKYLDVFKSRECHLPSAPHDRIECHIFSYSSGDRIMLSFDKDEVLPLYIRDEAYAIFNSIYPPLPE